VNARACPVVLAAPSGTGKTTLARRLVDDSDSYVFSVSATTRAARAENNAAGAVIEDRAPDTAGPLREP